MTARVDIATIAGTGFAFAMVAAAIILGGSVGNFLNLPSFLLVVLGTFAVTTVCFSLQEMAGSPKVIAKTIIYTIGDAQQAAIELLKLSDIARSQGILALEN